MANLERCREILGSDIAGKSGIPGIAIGQGDAGRALNMLVADEDVEVIYEIAGESKALCPRAVMGAQGWRNGREVRANTVRPDADDRDRRV